MFNIFFKKEKYKYLFFIIFLAIVAIIFPTILLAETEWKTIIVEPEKTISKVVMQKVLISDVDYDGVADEEDMYKEIPFHIIVSDYNFNGIDDMLEL